VDVVLIVGAVLWPLAAVFVFFTTSKTFGCAALALWALVLGGLLFVLGHALSGLN